MRTSRRGWALAAAGAFVVMTSVGCSGGADDQQGEASPGALPADDTDVVGAGHEVVTSDAPAGVATGASSGGGASIGAPIAAQEASLKDRAAFSTVSVVLHAGGGAAVAALAGDGDPSLGDAFETAVDVAETVVGAAIVTVGFLLPLVPLALLAWFVVLRRRRAAVPAPAPAPTT